MLDIKAMKISETDITETFVVEVPKQALTNWAKEYDFNYDRPGLLALALERELGGI